MDQAIMGRGGGLAVWLASLLPVLDGGGQEELIASASEAPQPEPDHREDLLGLAK